MRSSSNLFKKLDESFVIFDISRYNKYWNSTLTREVRRTILPSSATRLLSPLSFREVDTLVILEKLETGNWQLVHSDVVDLEMDQTTDPERRRRLRASIPGQHHVVTLDATGIQRGKELESFGISGLDALHLAAAEAGAVDVFLTTDDQLLRWAVKHGKRLRVRVANPLTWLQDVVEEES